MTDANRTGRATSHTRVVPNWRVGALYGGASLILIAAALLVQGWAWVLLWPALSAALVACGCVWLGAAIYRKRDGSLPIATRLLLGPQLAGQYISWLWYRRQCEPWNAVTQRVWLGRRLTDGEARQAIDRGVSAALDLTVNFAAPKAFRDIAYLQLPVMDLTAPTNEQTDRAIDFIREQARQGVVYVHCKAGYSRSAAIVAAYLLAEGVAADAQDAIARLYEARPGVVIRPEVREAIERCARRKHARRRA